MQQQPIIRRQSTFPLISKYFNTHPQDAVNFYHSMQIQMQDFVEAFRKRIQIQLSYSKNLQQVSKVLDKYIKPGTDISTSFICSAFKVEHEQRSRQSLELAESLKTQIETICTQFLKNQSAVLKRVEKDIKKYYKDAQHHVQTHRKAFQHFQNINKQMEQTIIAKNITRYTTGIAQEKKNKLISKANQNIKQSKSYQKAYFNSVKQYNTFASSYNKQINTHLDQVEKIIREQVTIQGDCMRKLIVAEVSMFKNMEYDLLNICKQMEVLDTQRNVEVFVEQEMNNTTNRIVHEEKEKEDEAKRPPSIELVSNQGLVQKPIIGKSMLSESIFFVEQEYFNWMLSNKNNRKLRDLISRIWKFLQQDLTNKQLIIKSESVQTQYKEEQGVSKIQTSQNEGKEPQTPNNKQQKSWQDELKETIAQFKILHPPNQLSPNQHKDKSILHERIFEIFMEIVTSIALLWNNEQIDANTFNEKLTSLQNHLSGHHLYRLAAMIFIQEFRQQKELVIKPNNIKMCAKIIRAVLNQSQLKNDVFIIRSVLSLIFTFYWTDDKAKRLMNLIPQIYQLEIWKKSDFWQAAIFETTLEQLISFSVKKEESQAESISRQKNIVFNQLASYCNNMIMLGMTSKNVKLTVGRFCRLYQLTEQQNKQLSKMINNTMKQYKQVYSILSVKVQKEKSNGD